MKYFADNKAKTVKGYLIMNPFEQIPVQIKDTIMDWPAMYPTAYNKMTVDPYTKARIIAMTGIESEAVMFKHQFHRNCSNNDLRRELALSRRIENQQQMHISWLKPVDETQLETTIGYEHAALDLTAWLAQNEPNAYVKQALDFALLEDLDHLYRYSNLLDLDSQIPAQQLVKSYVDITPGRPAIAEHGFPFDSVKNPVDFKTADIRTKLNTLIITAVEQQTMNFYMNIGSTYFNELGRQLYMEIAMIEEQHVSQYGSLLDPECTWLENLLLHEYTECYLYYSFYQYELDANVKSIWEMHLQQEIAHLHKAAELLRQYENKDWRQVIPEGEFPKLLQLHDTRGYVRQILGQQILLTSNREQYTPITELPKDHEFFFYQSRINHDVNSVASHNVIAQHQQKYNVDYRAQAYTSPVQELADQTADNTGIAR